MTFYQEILENNKKWIADKKANNKDFFIKLAQGQTPEVLYIGCSDSRVTAENMMGAEAGDVFIHRNIANVVSNIDLNVLSVIEYAVKHLKVKHIIVCGHYKCGGVEAAMKSQDLGTLNPWLQNIRDVYRLHQNELDAISDEKQRYERLVELNAQEQAFNVLKTAIVQESYSKNEYPTVHAWVFDIASGKLKDLNIDFSKQYEEIKKLYALGV